MKRESVLRAMLGSLLICATTTASAEGDAAKGQVKAITCMGCHGIAGYHNAYPNYPVPKVGGQSVQYLVSALKAYKSGERAHPTMQAQAASLSEQDMEDIAKYFAEAKSQ